MLLLAFLMLHAFQLLLSFLQNVLKLGWSSVPVVFASVLFDFPAVAEIPTCCSVVHAGECGIESIDISVGTVIFNILNYRTTTIGLFFISASE